MFSCGTIGLDLQEKDEDIRRELRKGNIVEIIEDSLDY
jgi:hypothetical protein